MKLNIRHLFLILILFININGFCQAQVALEQIQVYSIPQPKLNYWHLPKQLTALQKALDTGLFKKLNLTLSTTQPTQSVILSKQNQVGKILINWEATRNIPFHAYLEIYELDPLSVYHNQLLDISDDKKDSIQSIWAIACNIFNQKHDRIFQKTVLVGMMPIQSLGIGNPITTVATTPIALYQAIEKGVGLLNPSTINMDFIEAKVPLAYATDNYWMPLIHNQPRTLFDTSKQFIRFANEAGIQLLRIPPATLTKIDLKNKEERYPFKQAIGMIKKNRANYNSKEFYEVIQPLRDVQANKDYMLEAFVEYNPNIEDNGTINKQQSLVFMSELPQHIFEGKDSIGAFKVNEMVQEKNKFIFPDQIYNGYDSSNKFDIGTQNGSTKIIHAKVIEGNLYGHSFSIQFNATSQLKTILLDEKVIMIVEGTDKPHQMVNVANNINQPLKNLLLLMAFSEIFHNTN